MGLLNAGQMGAQYTLQKNSKKALKVQQAAAVTTAQREAALMQHIEYQSKVLAEIRDLLKAQQASD